MQDNTNKNPSAMQENLPGASHRVLVLAGGRSARVLTGLLLGCALWSHARAELSAPDNIVYGTITFGTDQVTAADSNVRVEARRSNGLTVASYTMGTRPEIGNFYALNLPVEELAPLRETSSVLLNEPLSIVLIRSQVVQDQSTLTLIERGQVYRLDFAIGSTNVLTGYDTWAEAHGLNAASQNLDADEDGASNWSEYVAGTHPLMAASRFALEISEADANVQVSFTALRAEGEAYTGLARHYVLERLAEDQSGTWETVPGFSDVLGANQQVIHTTTASGTPQFFRAKVSLAGSGP